MRKVRTAVILAAGYGTRLRPLTETCAKPALPFFNKTILHYLIEQLKSAGIEKVFINLHYKGDSIKQAFEKQPIPNISIEYSHEPQILGTAGALGPMRSYLTNETFVMINGDIVTDINFSEMFDCHLGNQNRLATVALHTASNHLGYPQIGATTTNILSRFPYGKLKNGNAEWYGTFAGVHVIEPAIFRYLHYNSFQCINSDIYPKTLEDGNQIGAYRHDGYWNDIGNPESYFKAHQDALAIGCIPNLKQNTTKSSWIHETAQIGQDTHIENNVFLYSKSCVKNNVRLGNVIVWPGIHIENGAHHQNEILLSNLVSYSLKNRDNHD